MSFVLPNKYLQRVDELQQLSDLMKKNLLEIDRKRNPNDIQHQVLFISIVRVIKYFDAYLILLRNGYGEPAASLIRSIYEASLWMRWSIISKENAQQYFDASKAEILRAGERLFSKGLAQLANAPDEKAAMQAIRNSIKNSKLPSWEELAKNTGLSDLHTYVYPMLSAMSHGTLYFLGKRLLSDKSVSPLPDDKNIEQFIPIANFVFTDCVLVCKEWIINGNVHPVPDIRKLMSRNR